MYNSAEVDPAAFAARIGRSEGNLDDQVGNQAVMLGNHEGARSITHGAMARAYEGAFVFNDGEMTTTAQNHERINQADNYTLTEYVTNDENLAATFHGVINT